MVLAGDIDNLCRSSSVRATFRVGQSRSTVFRYRYRVEAPSAEAVIEAAACGPHDRQPTTCAQGKCDALYPYGRHRGISGLTMSQ